MFTIATVNPNTGKRYNEDENLAAGSTRNIALLSVATIGALWALL
jgi:hypothetical protein